jgi:TolA-binding protein
LAGAYDAARTALQQVDQKTPAGLEALHWIAQSWLKQRRPVEALEAAAAGLEAADDIPQRVPLEMDRAEALALSPDHRAQAIEAYAALAAEHPQDPLAPQAQYLAAFTSLEIGEFQGAVNAADRFKERYADNALLPDVIGIEAEGRLQLGQYPESQRLYADLLSRFTKHRDAAAWRLRLAWSHYLQKQYRETIDLLAPQIASLPAGASQAEALFLIGSSDNELQEYAQAATAFEAAWKADPKWRQADEVLLGWAQAERQTNQFASARARLNDLTKNFPKSPQLDRAYYRLGELEYAQGDFAAAVLAYRRVIAGWLDSAVLPAARLGLGFSELGRGDADAASQAFTQLIDGSPQHELVPRARYGRALCRHQLKQYAAAVEDLQTVLAAGGTPERADAQYLLGLCQSAESKPAEAVATFRSLLSEQPKYAGADKTLYELAWALKAENKDTEAAEAFKRLAQEHPQSTLAAESAYHVGEAAYAKGDWQPAAAAYQQALAQAQAAGGKSPVGEQAAHKLAWTYYRQDDLNRAADEFHKQRAAWPSGPLADDARFMQGEILFKQEKYAEALAAFGEIKQPSNPEFLTLSLLHAGQAAGKLKQWDESLKLLGRCLDQAPNSPYLPEALYEQGWAQQNLGQLDAALASYEAVTAKTDREVAARARFMIGEIQFDKKDHKEAVRNFFKVAYSYGYPQWQAAAHYEAGRCFEVLGKPEQAKKSYEELVKQFPDSDRAAAAKERLVALAGDKS